MYNILCKFQVYNTVIHNFKVFLFMQNLKNKLVNITKTKKSHRYREDTTAYQWEEGRGRSKTLVED